MQNWLRISVLFQFPLLELSVAIFNKRACIHWTFFPFIVITVDWSFSPNLYIIAAAECVSIEMFYRLKNHEWPYFVKLNFLYWFWMKGRKVFLLNFKSFIFVFCLFLICSLPLLIFFRILGILSGLSCIVIVPQGSRYQVSPQLIRIIVIFLRILPLPLYSLIHLFNVKVLIWPGSWQCKHPLQPSFPWRRWIGALKRCQCCEQLQRKSYCCCRESCKLSSQGLSVIKC